MQREPHDGADGSLRPAGWFVIGSPLLIYGVRLSEVIHMTGQVRLRLLCVGASLLLVAGCGYESSSATATELFAKVRPGMTRSEVDELLGPCKATAVSSEGHTWYLSPPSIEPHESPYAPGSIGIVFGGDGRVVSATMNPQLRK